MLEQYCLFYKVEWAIFQKFLLRADRVFGMSLKVEIN